MWVILATIERASSRQKQRNAKKSSVGRVLRPSLVLYLADNRVLPDSVQSSFVEVTAGAAHASARGVIL